MMFFRGSNFGCRKAQAEAEPLASPKMRLLAAKRRQKNLYEYDVKFRAKGYWSRVYLGSKVQIKKVCGTFWEGRGGGTV
jgi:hypothetical protein